jgi:hypothetical protein
LVINSVHASRNFAIGSTVKIGLTATPLGWQEMPVNRVAGPKPGLQNAPHERPIALAVKPHI